MMNRALTLALVTLLVALVGIPAAVAYVSGGASSSGGGFDSGRYFRFAGYSSTTGYIAGPTPIGSAITAAVAAQGGTADFQYGLPWVAPFAGTVTHIDFEVTTGAGSAVMNVALYSANTTTGAPDARLTAASSIDCSTTGVKSGVISTAVVQGGLYWVAWTTNNTTIALRSYNTPIAGGMVAVGSDFNFSAGSASYFFTLHRTVQTYAVPPSTYPSTTPTNQTATFPIIVIG